MNGAQIEIQSVRKTQPNDVKQVWKKRTRDQHIGVAPHLLSFFGAGYMAINYYCIAVLSVFKDCLPESGNDHKIHFVKSSAISNLDREIIVEFLEFLKLQNVYQFVLYNSESPEGFFSVITVIYAIGYAAQNRRGAEESVWNLIEQFFDLKVNTIDSLVGKHLATTTTCYKGVHYCHNLNELDNGFFFDGIDKAYDFVYLQTDKHNIGEESELECLDAVVGESIADEGREDETVTEYHDREGAFMSKMLSYMKSISIERFESAENEERMELADSLIRDSLLAMNELVENEVIRGFEVQRAGVILIMNSGSFKTIAPLEIISTTIARVSTFPISSVKFMHFHISGNERCLKRDVKPETQFLRTVTVTMNQNEDGRD